MPKHTPNINLYKIDPSTDSNDTFNIDTALNDNWDKIDKAVGSIKVDIPDASLTKKGISKLSNAIDSDSQTEAATPKAVKAAYDRGSAGVTVADGVKASLTTHLADNTSHVYYSDDTGTANEKVVAIAPVPTAYKKGLAVAFTNLVQNTGAVTINVNGLGPKSVLKSNGSAFTSGNLKANSIYTVRYNGTSFILQGEGGGGTAQSDQVESGYTFTNDNGEQTGTLSKQLFVDAIVSKGVSATISDAFNTLPDKIGQIKSINIAPGNTIIFTNDAEALARSATYVKVKSISINKAGIYRVSFALRASSSTVQVKAILYKNNSAIGIERKSNTITDTVYSEDLTLMAGDVLDVWGLTPDTTWYPVISNFRLSISDKFATTLL